MGTAGTDFYATTGAMTALPDDPRVAPHVLPPDIDGLRRVVQGLLLHHVWAPSYGVTADAIRLGEENLRSTAEVLARAFELSPEPVTVARAPIDRVVCICRHFALLYTALLRRRGIPARARCGFSNYFDPAKWYDHWVTERWDGTRWARDDPQVGDLQAEATGIDFDPHDQPAGKFLSGAEAWRATRAGEVDPGMFGIFDMWGLPLIAGNVLIDFACLNKVELLPWDGWGMMTGPHAPVAREAAAVLDEVSALAAGDDVTAIRARYQGDDRLRVPPEITTIVDGRPVPARLDL